MRHLEWEAEPVSKTGSVMSEGVLNQLGRPNIDMLAVLLREAVQNSWDARVSNENSVIFGMAGWTLSSDQRLFLQEELFAECPSADKLPLADELSPQQRSLFGETPFHVLAVYDRGTVGLGGPTRADILASQGEQRNFVNFLRNVGQPPDRQLSGGTYGYGKAAFYLASKAQTICVHTRCYYEDKLQTRFMAAALGRDYIENHKPYTGRHWWGYFDDEIVQPITDADADTAANILGLPTFADQECGTTILILQPRWGNAREPLQAVNFLVEQMLYYFWPKMLPNENGIPPIVFEAFWEDEQIIVPNPEEFAPLKGFVQAMKNIKGRDDDKSPFRRTKKDISSDRPNKRLGTLTLQQFPRIDTNYFDTGAENGEPFADLTHHTALMRQPELVVRYLPGINMLNDKVGYAGVFITDEDVDSIFASAEPPTHDDWIAKSLHDKNHQTYINVALRRIREAMDEFVKPSSVRTSEFAELTPLGAFANRLGESLLPAQEGSSAALFKPPIKPQPRSPMSNQSSASLPFTPAQPSDLTPSSPPTAAPASLFDFDSEERDTPEENPMSAIPPFVLPPPLSRPYVPSPNFSEEPDSVIQSTPPTVDSGYVPPIPDRTEIFQPPPPSRPPQIIGKPKLRVLRDEYLLFEGIQTLRISFEVIHAVGSAGTLITIDASAVLDGDQLEADPPEGGAMPEILQWFDPDGMPYPGKQNFFISSDQLGVCAVIVSLLDDAAVDVDFSVEAKAFE